MRHNIYLVLTGENEHQRPRSKKLLAELKKETKPYTVVVSGLSCFNLTQNPSESSKMADYLVAQGVPRKYLVLEEESLDTLGNMVFSCALIAKLLRPDQGYNLILITEGFHMYRSRILLEQVFCSLSQKFKVNFQFKTAPTFNLSHFYWQRKIRLLLQDIKQHHHAGREVKELIMKALKIEKLYIRDHLILDLILTDVEVFSLKSYQDFQNYLFSLPIYCQKYHPQNRYDMQNSLYAKAIEHRS
ncbi:MAG: hypothetical protein A2233_01890 [Candidatus Kerfeldbacteria bacterium RIFOXYA2_FULL_38_24]|uniref:DUF218 domain-containing protein n=1 Tax=Candidatus Kerfeldbacteria bacterium RIFOXYB2_FULL_38_14 TaxID=1798547 RepID=A0A1G2BEL8_9BACT|nr:MAG: hypothetical protein A2319_04495 [Candidatus Kerfeldbacteria bacterium RIFOXYB2_FULL_38_14]OGY87867.1 MAG: hypothetical protein A2233_01890 [Candidatus Kerfeldbacteria bacterium RIFOXYA2_FULL_38_24]OGY90014.1 MAG: hypothetical protein A2458_00015 [Candidatus Kerfeldbacteria bacterium RIFOXYC2_FULL_38_9]